MGSTHSERPLAAVTGASSGIGYELARQFAMHGYDLLVTAADEGIARLADDFAEYGCQVRAEQLDLCAVEGVRAFSRAIQREFRPLDAIAINDGASVCGEFARETPLDEELGLIQLNVLATVQLTKSVLPNMIKRKQGRVLLTSSAVALIPRPYEAVYCASKAFLLSFASSLHAELLGTGVTVTALVPAPQESESFHFSEAQLEAEAAALLGFRAMLAGEERVVSASIEPQLYAEVSRYLPQSRTNSRVHSAHA